MTESMMIDLAAAICERLESHFVVQPTLTLAQAAEALGVSQEKVRQLCNEGKIPYVRMDRLYRIKPGDINKYIEANYHR